MEMLNNKDLPSKDEFIDAVEGAIKVFNELDIKKLKEEIDKLKSSKFTIGKGGGFYKII